MSDKKNNLKSIRLSDRVMNYIQNYRGDGFNEKFENIILDAMESEDRRIRDLERYDAQIQLKKQQYFSLCSKLRSLDPMVQACLHINSRIRNLNDEFDVCISELARDPGSAPKN